MQNASDWLRDQIEEAGGQMAKTEVMLRAKSAGFSERTIYRARRLAGVEVKQSGFGPAKQSTWKLAEPSIVPIVPREPVGTDGTNGEVGTNGVPVDVGVASGTPVVTRLTLAASAPVVRQ